MVRIIKRALHVVPVWPYSVEVECHACTSKFRMEPYDSMHVEQQNVPTGLTDITGRPVIHAVNRVWFECPVCGIANSLTQEINANGRG